MRAFGSEGILSLAPSRYAHGRGRDGGNDSTEGGNPPFYLRRLTDRRWRAGERKPQAHGMPGRCRELSRRRPRKVALLHGSAALCGSDRALRNEPAANRRRMDMAVLTERAVLAGG